MVADAGALVPELAPEMALEMAPEMAPEMARTARGLGLIAPLRRLGVTG